MQTTLIPKALFLCAVISATTLKAQNFEKLSADDFERKMDSLETRQLVDVRSIEEYKKGHLQTARQLDFKGSSFTELLDVLKKDRPVFVYSRTGSVSEKAAAKMIEVGFEKVYVLQGGITAWKNAGKPVISETVKSTKDKFTSDDLKDIINSESVVLIDFYTDWCIPCMKMKPALDTLANEYKGKVLITSINVEHAKVLANELGIREIPVVKAYKTGKLVETYIGYLPEYRLRTIIKNMLAYNPSGVK